MKKTKTLAKRILSVALATMIVLSFALISVSALPANYTQVGTNGELINFDNGYGHTSQSDAAIELSTEHFRGGSGKSLKIMATDNDSTMARCWYSNGVKFEPNSAYYVSYWYYTDFDWIPNFGGLDAASGLAIGTKYYSGTAGGQWKKVWFTITTGDTVGGQWFRPSFWTIGAGNCVYIDDLEVRQIESATGLKNDIPAGTTAAKVAYAYGENAGFTEHQLANGTDSGDTVEKTIEYAHWSEQSYKFVANYKDTNKTGDTGVYVSLTESMFLGEGLKANTPYYISYYVYCPTKTVSTRFIYFSGAAIINHQTVPQGQWTKVSALFVPDEATATAANSHLLRLWIRDTKDADGVNHPVYLDDLVIAELALPEAAALTMGEVVGSAQATKAKLTINSSVELKDAGTVTVEGATVDSAVLSENKMSIEVSVSGLYEDTSYMATITDAKDMYDRTIDTALVAFATPTAEECPMDIVASTIVDGATDVAAPVSHIYIDTPYAIDSTTLAAEDFAITGYDASITAVALTDSDTIKVSLDGIVPSETYTLSVDNVANAAGGVLKDSITFTTKDSYYAYNVGFEGATIPSNVKLSSADIGSYELSAEKAHTGSQSLKLTANSNYGGFAKMQLDALTKDVPFVITFWYYSDTWTGNTANSQYGTYENWQFSSTKTGQWNKAQVTFTSIYHGANISFWGLGTDGTIYIDDIDVQALDGKVGQPVILSNNAAATGIAAGNVTIELPVTDASSVLSYAVQYDADGKMISATAGAVNIDGNVEFTLTGAQAVKTKVILWNAETFVPVCNTIIYN